MKEKIMAIREFFLFYMSIPLFVLLLLSASVGEARTQNMGDADAEERSKIEEMILNSSHDIEDEPVSPSDTYPIVARNLSNTFNILNATKKNVDEEKLISASLPYPYVEDAPLVLIVHTHGSESYANPSESFSTPDKKGYYGFYTEKSKTRDLDRENNVVAVGEAFARVLSKNGVGVIQCRIMHDEEDYNSAYENSRGAIKEYLEKFPSIKYVIDVHRDSLTTEEKEKIKVMSDFGTAQVMLVAGCEGNGVIHPNWEDNLSVNLKFKKVMDTKYPSLSRPIYLRHSRYNLDLTKGSLLLEVGTCANTLEEAIKAAELAAECFACVLLE